MAITLETILERLEKQSEEARTSNLLRYEQAMAIYDEIVSRYRPGGEFEKASLAELERQKVREVGKEQQAAVSGGLTGTTTFGGIGRRWEEEVGAPSRLKLEDILMQRLSQAQIGKAGLIESREDVYPDYGMIAQLAGQSAAMGGTTGGVTGGVTHTRLVESTNPFMDMLARSTPLKSYAEEMAEKRAARGESEGYRGELYGEPTVPTEGISDLLAQGYTLYGPGGKEMSIEAPKTTKPLTTKPSTTKLSTTKPPITIGPWTGPNVMTYGSPEYQKYMAWRKSTGRSVY